jgi:hypothetical protein
LANRGRDAIDLEEGKTGDQRRGERGAVAHAADIERRAVLVSGKDDPLYKDVGGEPLHSFHTKKVTGDGHCDDIA